MKINGNTQQHLTTNNTKTQKNDN